MNLSYTLGEWPDIFYVSYLGNCCRTRLPCPHEMLKEEIRSVFESGKCCKTDGKNHGPIMKSTNLPKLSEYIILPIMEINEKTNPRQIGFRPITKCQAAISTIQEITRCCSQRWSDVRRAMIYFSKIFNCISFIILITILKGTQFPT